MSIFQILDRIPKGRRDLLYYSDIHTDKIDYSGNTFNNRFGQNKFTFRLTDLGFSEEKILELVKEKLELVRGKNNKEIEELPSEFSPINNFYENETEDYFDDMQPNYPNSPEFNRPSYEWDSHTIFIDLPIKEYFEVDEYLKGDLFLSTNYRKMYPENRFRYLNWLSDTTRPIEKSYIYLYIECLERGGLDKNIEEIIDELLLIKKFHFNINKAIVKKIDNTITLLCFYKKRFDLLFELFTNEKVDEISSPILYYHFINNIGLKTKDILLILKRLQFKLTIIKGFEALFQEALSEIFKVRYNSQFFPINDYCKIDNVPLIKKRFSNWNLNTEIGEIDYPELWYEESLNNELIELYKLSYEKFKVLKKNRKK
jgi:hypothetical protein